MGDVGIGECPHDEDQRVGLGQVSEQGAAKALLRDPLGDAGDVEVLHVRRDPAFRLEHLRQDVEPRVRDLDGGQVRLVGVAGVRARLSLRPC